MEDKSTPIKSGSKVKDYISAVGKRKEAVARVRLTSGAGLITINGKPSSEYFSSLTFQKIYQRPFDVTKTTGKFKGTIKLSGGGTSSQLGAVVHGISRALSLTDASYRSLLKKEGFLTRDARVKERRKFGLAQKARAKKQSPKR